ncbi:MAG: zinc-dependent alcohol dehydrogenase family protein [Coraliomargaritaceae bacterium]
MKKNRAIVYRSHGNPSAVLSLEERAVPWPSYCQVRVRLLAANINPSDLGMVAGSYGQLRELPAVAGREAIGEVDFIGEGVDGVEIGTRVRFPQTGAWQEYACSEAAHLEVVPEGVPLTQAVQSFINPPTAWCLLRERVALSEGAWVLQNAGNSAVGLSVIQMAKEMGYRTINEVRRESLVDPLKNFGADEVVLSDSGWQKRVNEITAGEPVQLAFNSVGGNSALNQIRALGEGGVQVTFGGMAREPVRFPTRELIFKDLCLSGFWWDQWSKKNEPDACKILHEVHQRMADGRLYLPVAEVFPLDRFEEALTYTSKSHIGKVLLAPDPDRLAEEA